MKSKIIIAVLMLVFTDTCYTDEPLPIAYLDKIETMPDFCQVDERFGPLPGHGTELCAPTALSNALVWLNGHGFPNLPARAKPTLADQAELIRSLSSKDFLATDEHTGTPPKQVIAGIERYLKAANYDCHVEQMGWRSSVHRIGKIPEEKWLLRSCMGHSNLLINVGWYKRHEKQFTRLDGHWITLVGFKEENGHRILYVHDPGRHSGIEKKTEPCRLIALPKHHSLEFQNGDPISADGYFQLEGIHVKQGADLAIIDGAVAFAPSEKLK